MDLHIEGSRPVTLFVRDESHSTSGRQDTNTACSTPRSNGRSPIHSLLQPQPHQHSRGGSGGGVAGNDNASPMSATLALQIVKQDEEARMVEGSGATARPYSALANTEAGAKSKRQNEGEDLSQIK